MNPWMDELARALEEDPIDPRETGAILRLAREVAHGVERKLAPLSTFLIGIHVGRQQRGGGDRAAALDRAVKRAVELLPDQTDEVR